MPISFEEIKKSVQNNHLHIDGIRLKDDDINIICKFLEQHKSITSLFINSKYIGDEGAKALAEMTSLRSLDVSVNKIGDEGAEALAKMTSLTSLDVSDNKIGYIGTNALKANTSIKSINMRNCGLDGKEAIVNISMMVFGGFIAALGVTAVAIAFTSLHAATFGIAGVAVAGIGIAALTSGVGLFASGAYRDRLFEHGRLFATYLFPEPDSEPQARAHQ